MHIKKLGVKISIWVIAVIAVAMGITLYVTTMRTNKMVADMSMKQAQRSNTVFAETFSQYREIAIQRAEIVAGSSAIVDAVLQGDDEQLARILANFGTGMDFLTVCDVSGVTLARTHSGQIGDSIRYMRAVSIALETGRGASTVESGTLVGFSIRGSAAIVSPDGDIIGVALCGYDLAESYIVDRVKEKYGCESSIFEGETRISTTVKDADGDRIVGTSIGEDVLEPVLRRGAEYSGRQVVFGVTYELYATPIYSDREIVGILMTGVNIEDILAERTTVLRWTLIATLTGILAAVLVVLLICRRIIGKPLEEIGAVAQSIRGGTDFIDKINVRSPDEVGQLSLIFNEMIERLASSTTSLNTLKAIMNGMEGNLYVSDLENDEILFINDAMKQDFGLDDTAVGQPCWRVFQKDFTKRCSFCRNKRLLDNPGESITWEEYNTANRRYYKNTDRIIGWSGGRTVHLQHSVDITDLKSAEEEMLRAKELAENASRAKGEFLSRMSHEIRTPMNAIIGLTEIELHRSPQKEAADIYRKVNSSAKHLLEIINDILDFSKIEADKIDLFQDRFELEDVLSSAMLVASPRLEGKEVEFLLNIALDVPRFLIGDRTRLWQVLKNFLDNSAKFTDRGKVVLDVYIDVNASDDEIVTLHFDIDDTGIGISEDKLSRIFQPYMQIHNEAQRRYTGTGLGMVIAKQLCELMGGVMNIESRVARGTTVHLRIPFARAAGTETCRDHIRLPDLEGRSVLVVDDDALSVEIMRRLLANGGAACVTAHSGQEALDIVCDRRDRGVYFDLILLDYLMEGMDGLETAQRIHQALSQAPKVLMVTAYQKRLIKRKQRKSHIDDVIEKPFVPSYFIRKVCEALNSDAKNGTGNRNLYMVEPITVYRDVRVLLFEDYVLNQEVAVGMLEHFGIAATIVENGRQGLDILNSGESFDLIFMDLQMPVMDGYETARVIRADSRYDEIPIISMTADAMMETVDRCLAAGMDDHVAKPIEFSRLEQIFLKWLPESKRARDGQAPKVDSSTEEAGLMRFGGDRARYKEALRQFVRELPDTWPGFQNAVAETERTCRLIHGIKGMAGNMAETEIYECARELERCMLAGNPTPAQYEKLIALCAGAKRRITGLINPIAGPTEVGSPEEIIHLLERLGQALGDYDPVAVNDALVPLRAKIWPEENGPWLQRLLELAAMYEFDEALALLETGNA